MMLPDAFESVVPVLQSETGSVPSVEVGATERSKCPACWEELNPVFGMKDEYTFRECTNCSTLYTTERPSVTDTATLYDHYYDNASFGVSPVVAASLGRVIDDCAAYRKTGNWLDVAFGEGGMLSLVEERGWNCYGSEVSVRALEHGSGKGWIVTSRLDNDPRFIPESFDVVSMIEFLEHVADPEPILQDVARLLRPGGLLYLTTPNASSFNSRTLGLAWSVFTPPEHLTIWSEKGMRFALGRLGFQILQVRTEGFNPKELLDRVRPKSGTRESVPSRNDVAFTLNAAFSSSPGRRIIKTAVNRILTLTRSGDTLKVRAIKSPLLKIKASNSETDLSHSL